MKISHTGSVPIMRWGIFVGFDHLIPVTPILYCSCQCQGHSNFCHKESGESCDCRNNTKSPRCDDPKNNPDKECYELQVKLQHNRRIWNSSEIAQIYIWVGVHCSLDN